MGIFFDVCDALIDPATGRALTGEALDRAMADRKWPRCGNTVSKRARFCNSCGKPAPGGWWKCPSCKKWIGNDSRFCPHCNQPLYPEERAAMAGGVWSKEVQFFAQRFEVGDVKRLLNSGIQVQEGTLAILLDAGNVSDILEPGRHNPDSLARKINWFGNPPPRSVVLVDASEIVVPLHVESLRTSENFPIDFYGEVMLRFKGDKDAAKAFIGNILGAERSCTFKDLSANFERAVRVAVDEMCVTSTLDDLVRDPDRRIRLQERMSARLTEDLKACGLELVRVSSAEFTGDEYEAYADKLGDLDIKRREVEYRAALRKLFDKDAMAVHKEAAELAQYKEIVDHEYRLSHEGREREFKLIQREHSHDDIVYQRMLEVENLEQQHKVEDIKQHHQHAQESRQTEHDISINSRMDEYERGKKVGDAQSDVQAQDIHTQQDVKDAMAWLDVKMRKNAIKQQDKGLDAERRKGMNPLELLAEIEDVKLRQDIFEMYKLQLQSGMSPEQILAQMGKSHYGPEYEQFMQKMADLYKDNSDRAERGLAGLVSALKVNINGNVSQGAQYNVSSHQHNNNQHSLSSHHQSWQDMNVQNDNK